MYTTHTIADITGTIHSFKKHLSSARHVWGPVLWASGTAGIAPTLTHTPQCPEGGRHQTIVTQSINYNSGDSYVGRESYPESLWRGTEPDLRWGSLPWGSALQMLTPSWGCWSKRVTWWMWLGLLKGAFVPIPWPPSPKRWRDWEVQIGSYKIVPGRKAQHRVYNQ